MENIVTPTANTPGIAVSGHDSGFRHDRGLESKDLTAILSPFLLSDIKDNALHVKDSHIAIERARADTLVAARETQTMIVEQAHQTRELIRSLDADRTKVELAEVRGRFLAAAAGKVAPSIAV